MLVLSSSEATWALPAALDIAHRIGSQAIWDSTSKSCTWNIRSVDWKRPSSRVSVVSPAGIDLYQGVSGIVVFLAAAYPYAPSAHMLRVIRGACRFLSTGAQSLPPGACSFFVGRVGVAWALLSAGRSLGDERWNAPAKKILESLAGHEKSDTALDVVGGAAGAIPPLIRMGQDLRSDRLQDTALRYADRLISTARRGPSGWSIPSTRISHVRDLTGLAHGAAGMTRALLEAYLLSGRTKYLYGSEESAAFENSYYSDHEQNWFDFRHDSLGELEAEGRLSQLRTNPSLRSAIQPYRGRFMAAWCHGAPGILMVRLRTAQVQNTSTAIAAAWRAVPATLRSVERITSGFSLCHGVCGNADALIFSAEVLSAPEVRQKAMNALLHGVKEYVGTGRSWPCGTVDGLVDPSLMLGEAGIGLSLLRAVDRNLESPLLPSGVNVVKPHSSMAVDDDLLAEDRSLFFSQSLMQSPDLIATANRLRDPASGISAARSLLLAVHESVPPTDAHVAYVRSTEIARYEVARDHSRVAIFLSSVDQPPDIDWLSARIVFAETTKVIPSPESDSHQAPPEDGTLIFADLNQIYVRPIGRFPLLVLQAIEGHDGLADICSFVASNLPNGDPSDPRLVQKVIDQLMSFHRAAIVSCAPLMTRLDRSNAQFP